MGPRNQRKQKDHLVLEGRRDAVAGESSSTGAVAAWRVGLGKIEAESLGRRPVISGCARAPGREVLPVTERPGTFLLRFQSGCSRNGRGQVPWTGSLRQRLPRVCSPSWQRADITISLPMELKLPLLLLPSIDPFPSHLAVR